MSTETLLVALLTAIPVVVIAVVATFEQEARVWNEATPRARIWAALTVFQLSTSTLVAGEIGVGYLAHSRLDDSQRAVFTPLLGIAGFAMFAWLIWVLIASIARGTDVLRAQALRESHLNNRYETIPWSVGLFSTAFILFAVSLVLIITGITESA